VEHVVLVGELGGGHCFRGVKKYDGAAGFQFYFFS
jgi:hypothetical protein